VVTQANSDLKPETMFSWEVGGEMKPFDGTSFAVSYFRHYLKDLIYRQNVSTYLIQVNNAGAAKVEGLELKLKQRLYWDWLDFNGSLTLNNSKITSNTANPLTVGKDLTGTPRIMFSSGLDIHYQKWSGGIIGRYVGKQYGNDQNTDTVNNVFGSYDPYFLVDTRLKYQATKNVGLSFSVNNLLDRDYYSYYKQAGRTVYGDVSVSF
jgi:iron complex outermembrane receptor protein